jgi:hypothetical protein
MHSKASEPRSLLDRVKRIASNVLYLIGRWTHQLMGRLVPFHEAVQAFVNGWTDAQWEQSAT